MRPTLEAEGRRRLSGQEVAMAGSKKPGETGDAGPDAKPAAAPGHRDDLDRRSRALDEALAARRPAPGRAGNGGKPGTDGLTGFGQALKMSSEFIAGIAVGAGLGWLIDRLAGTSPWGLIVFLLLGFAAGVLNVLRSAGLIAEPDAGARGSAGRRRDEN